MTTHANHYHIGSRAGLHIANFFKSASSEFRAPTVRLNSTKLDRLTDHNQAMNWIVPVAWQLASCSGLLYALRILRTHGMSVTSLYDVYRATIAAKLVYCSPAWSGFRSAVDINQLDAFLKQCKRCDYCPDDFPNISKLFSDVDDQLFSRISYFT